MTRGRFYDLSFGMYFFYTSCTSEWSNQPGRTPICRDSRVNPMFYTTFPMSHITTKPRRPRVGCTTSALVCTSCTRGVQGNVAIVWVVLQSAEILGLIIIMFCNTFPMSQY